MKKRVAILFSGQMRTNSLNPTFSDTTILDSLDKYLFNNNFKTTYEYDVFFSVDTIDLDKTKNFFGEHLKNVHLTETDWYMNPVKNTIPEYTFFHDKYLKSNFRNCPSYVYAIYQYYRMYAVYNMCKNYQLEEQIKYDYFVRIRPDIRVMQDIMLLFYRFETSHIKISMEHEQICVVTPELEDMFNLINFYGEYTDPFYSNLDRYKFMTMSGHHQEEDVMLFSPEKQFVDHVYSLLYKNKIKDEYFLRINYPSFGLLYRGDNKYGYIDYSYHVNDPHYVWRPFTTI